MVIYGSTREWRWQCLSIEHTRKEVEKRMHILTQVGELPIFGINLSQIIYGSAVGNGNGN